MDLDDLRIFRAVVREGGITRAAAWSALDAGFEDQLLVERESQRDAGRTADFSEGVQAFKDKRAPQFSGR